MTGRQKLGWFGAAIVALVAANCFVEVNGQAPSLQPLGQRAPISVEIPPAVFQGWPANQKPEFVLVLTGQQQSYLKFCGCTERQLGGFERRYNFMTKLRERGWPVIGVDLGDLADHKSGTPANQTILKFDAAIRCLAALSYNAVALGELDFKLPLDDGTSNNVLQDPSKFPTLLCANVKDAAVRFPASANESFVRDVAIIPAKNGAPRIGVTSVAAPEIAGKLAGTNTQFTDYKAALSEALKKMESEKVQFRILLCQGNYEFARILAGAPNINKQVDPTFADKFDVILCLSDQEEPPAKQDQDVFGRTNIVRIGHRGRYIGVMGVFRGNSPANPFDKKFQIVEMSEEYETDKGKEAENPILKILQDYAKEVQSQAFVRQIPQREHPLKSTFKGMAVAYVGSDKCKACHAQEYAIWESAILGSKKKHSHSKAFEALTKVAKKPSLRQFDPECVLCHTVGYGFQTGYFGDTNEKKLLDVGCENCHGPGSLHLNDQNNQAYLPSLSVWKANKNDLLPLPEKLQKGFNALLPNEQHVVKNVNELCQKCHDTDNDPTFKFETFWPRIQHGRGKKPMIPPQAESSKQ